MTRFAHAIICRDPPMNRPLTETEQALYDEHCAAQREKFMAAERAREAGLHVDVSPTAPWWIAIANTGCEARAMLGLHAAGYEVWRPSRWFEARIGKSRALVCKQEFPAAGYLLTRHARLTASDMAGIEGLRAIRVWADGRGPQTVPAHEVDNWRRRLAGDEQEIVEDAYKVGQSVRIMSGPFATLNAIVMALGRGDAVDVSITMFGRDNKVSVKRGQVEVVS